MLTRKPPWEVLVSLSMVTSHALRALHVLLALSDSSRTSLMVLQAVPYHLKLEVVTYKHLLIKGLCTHLSLTNLLIHSLKHLCFVFLITLRPCNKT